MAFILIILFSVLPAYTDVESTYEVDTSSSKIRWTGSKLIGDHYGTLQLQNGSFTLEGNKLLRGNFTIDMRSLENQDLEGERREKLETWLRSEEMFYVERYPTVSFKIAAARYLSEQQQYEVKGQLTIKGISHDIVFPAIIEKSGSNLRVQAEITFDRTRWNLNYGSGGLVAGVGNFAIDDEVEVAVDLIARN